MTVIVVLDTGHQNTGGIVLYTSQNFELLILYEALTMEG